MLGNGWVKGRFGFGGEPGNFETCDPGTPREVVIDRFMLRLELRVTFADGREWVLGTDESWQCAPAPVLMSSIYDGELYDQRRELAGWDTPEGDGLDWLPVEKAPMNRPVAEPEDRLSLPVTRHETFTPTCSTRKKGNGCWISVRSSAAGWKWMWICPKMPCSDCNTANCCRMGASIGTTCAAPSVNTGLFPTEERLISDLTSPSTASAM